MWSLQLRYCLRQKVAHFWPRVGRLHILRDTSSQRESPKKKGIGNLISHLRGHRRGTGYWVAHVVSWLNWRSPTCCCSNEWPGGYSTSCTACTVQVLLPYSVSSRMAARLSLQSSGSTIQCTLRPRDSVLSLVLQTKSKTIRYLRHLPTLLCLELAGASRLSLFHCPNNEPYCSSIVSSVIVQFPQRISER